MLYSYIVERMCVSLCTLYSVTEMRLRKDNSNLFNCSQKQGTEIEHLKQKYYLYFLQMLYALYNVLILVNWKLYIN